MSDTRDGESFLRRWSRVKTEARETVEPRAAAPAPEVRKENAGEPAPELPPIEKLTLESDYSGFFHPKVDENVRRQALRKLFSDPHFNVMDGLDVYIDDYSKSEPIPAAMLASLKQAQRILEWAADKSGEHNEGGERTELETGKESGTDAAPAGLEDLRSESVARGGTGSAPVQAADALAGVTRAKT